jgi:DNA-binding CsgD family transcriptional regulator/tetratricopeptide (TPR) repeat protein
MTTGGGEFVGRERELGAILEAAGRAGGGRGATLLVEGSSGMGATRLLDEAVVRLRAADQVEGPGPVVVRGDELPAWRATPYAPFRAALEGLLATREPAEVTRLLGHGAELLLPLLPATAERLGVEPARPTVRELLPDRIREAVRAVVCRLAADRLVVLVIEDLHVLDAASRSLIAFLGPTLGEHAVLLLGSYQPEALGPGHPLRATLAAIGAAQRPPERLTIPPLDRAALRSLIAAHENQAPSAPTLLLVAERSAGSPLVAEEVLAARRELSGASLSVPFDQLVVARAERRSPECRRLLRILAAAGGPLDAAEIAAVVRAYDAEVGRPAPRSPIRPRRADGDPPVELDAAAAEAVEHGFVERVARVGEPAAPGRVARGAGGRGRDTRALRVRHELLATALTADLLPGSRRRMHAALGAALEERRPADAGRHAHRAHEPVRELGCEISAASFAEAAGAAEDALGHLERAIELAGAPIAGGELTADEELRLLVRAADAAEEAGNTGRAEAFLELALARLARVSDREAVAELTAHLGSVRLAGGDPAGAMAAFGRALELLPAGPSVLRARLLATQAQVRMIDGVFTEAGDLAAAAIEAATRSGPPARAWSGHATCTLGVVNGWLGHSEVAVEQLEAALAVAIDLGRLEDAFRARANLTTALDLQGRRDEAVAVARAGIRAAEEVGLEIVHGNLLRGNAVDMLVSLGRWAEARAMAERALEWAPSGVPFVTAALGLAIIEVETAAGDAAAGLLGRLFLDLETVADVQAAAPAFQAAASLALWRGDVADAVRAANAGWERVRSSEDWPNAARTAATLLAVADARARIARDRNDLAELVAARSWGDDVLRHATRMVEAAGAPADSWVRLEVDADLATARALADRIHGRDDAAAWAAVATRWRALGRPYETARALHREMEAILDAGSRSGARREGRGDAQVPLAEATTIAVGLGAIPLLRALADVAERARLPLAADATALLAAGPPAAGSPDEVPPAGGSDRARAGTTAADDRRAADRRTADSFGLTPREIGVLAEIVAGRTNREIGKRLFISDKTVGVHVGSILAKLGVGGRVEAATVALRLGLVDDRLARTTKPGPGGPGFRGRRRSSAA